MVVAKRKLTIPLLAGIIPRADLFYSVVTRDTVPDEHYRAFAFHFRPDAPAPQQRERLQTLLGVDERECEAIVTRRILLPSPQLGHDAVVNQIDRLTADLRLFITGNYFSGMAIEDCVGRSFAEFARLRRMG